MEGPRDCERLKDNLGRLLDGSEALYAPAASANWNLQDTQIISNFSNIGIGHSLRLQQRTR
jgi:hypothetical protein